MRRVDLHDGNCIGSRVGKGVVKNEKAWSVVCHRQSSHRSQIAAWSARRPLLLTVAYSRFHDLHITISAFVTHAEEQKGHGQPKLTLHQEERTYSQ